MKEPLDKKIVLYPGDVCIVQEMLETDNGITLLDEGEEIEFVCWENTISGWVKVRDKLGQEHEIDVYWLRLKEKA